MRNRQRPIPLLILRPKRYSQLLAICFCILAASRSETTAPVKITHHSARYDNYNSKCLYNQMFAKQPTIISISADVAVLELRIGLKNDIRGQWEKQTEGDMPPEFFQMAYVPHLDTRAIFSSPVEYQTFDIHLHHSFLESIGVQYALLEKFLTKVVRGDAPAELTPVPYPCTRAMLQLVQMILSSDHSAVGRAQMLHHHVSAIVIAALEVVSREVGLTLPLSKVDKAALHDIRELIALHMPEYLSNDVLLSKVFPRLNAFKLGYGFKRLFGMNPYEYYQQLRFARAKELLEKGKPVEDVSFTIQYQSSTAFIAAFKERFGATPKQWMKR